MQRARNGCGAPLDVGEALGQGLDAVAADRQDHQRPQPVQVVRELRQHVLPVGKEKTGQQEIITHLRMNMHPPDPQVLELGKLLEAFRELTDFVVVQSLMFESVIHRWITE